MVNSVQLFIARIKTPLGVQYVATVVTALVGFLFMYVLTNQGSIEIFGQYLALLSASSLLNNLVGVRTNEAAIRFGKEALIGNNLGKQAESLLLGIVLDLLIASVLFAIFAFFSTSIAENLLKDTTQADSVVSYGLYVFLVAASGTLNGYLIAADRLVSHGLLQITSSAVKICGLLVMILLTGQLSLNHVVMVLVLSAVVLLTPLIWVAPTILRSALNETLFTNRIFIRTYLSFSFTTFASGAFKAGNRKIDDLAISLFLNPQALGVYGIVKQFFAPVALITAPIATVMAPRFVEVVTLSGKGLAELIKSTNQVVFVFLVSITFLLSALTLIYLSYVDVEWAPIIIGIVLCCACTSLMQAIQWWARPFSNAVDPKMSLRINFVAMLITLFLLVPAIYFYGVIGAALSSLLIALIIFLYWRSELASYALS